MGGRKERRSRTQPDGSEIERTRGREKERQREKRASEAGGIVLKRARVCTRRVRRGRGGGEEDGWMSK